AIYDVGMSRGKTIRILPYLADNDYAGSSPVGSVEGRDSSPAGVVPFAGDPDDDTTRADERERTMFFEGTGAGSNVELYFNPTPPEGSVPVCPRDGQTTVKGPCKLVWTEAEKDKSEQLLHELVHALRQMRGELNPVPTWDKGYDNEEEF